jgi:hypothetical protein
MAEITRGLLHLEYNDQGAGAAVDILGARSFEANYEAESETFTGDDRVMATAFDPPTGSGSITLAALNPDAEAAFIGATPSNGGTAPNTWERVVIPGTPITAEGALTAVVAGQDVAGSSLRVILPSTKVAPPSLSFSQEEYAEPSHDISFLADDTNQLIILEWWATTPTLDAGMTVGAP